MQARPIGQIHGIKLLGEPELAPDQPAVTHGKFLIVTPRKVGKACVRNRLRRQLKAIIYEQQLGQVPMRMALMCYPAATERTLEELQSFLQRSLQRFLPKRHERP